MPILEPLEELRRTMNGRLLLPGDPGYDPARTVFYGNFDRRPAAVARPADAGDVALVIRAARQAGLELAVRSGGHSLAGHSLSHGGIVLDLRGMRALAIDPARGTAWAESGLTAGEYTAAAGVYSLATPFGDTTSVGIGGITLGGGVGFLTRKHGMTVDNLLAAEIVTADGQLLRADACAHPELFWALRGGGGNFGVVTRFQYALRPVSTVVGGMLILPADPQVIADFIAEAEAAPDELTTIANVMVAPPVPFLPPEVHGRLILLVMMVYAGGIEAGERVAARFRRLATPLADLLRAMRYPEIFQPEDPNYHPRAVTRTLFVEQIGQAAAQVILDRLQALDADMRVAQLRVLGGAAARVPLEETAYAHRKARILVELISTYTGEEDRPVREAWLEEFAAALPDQRDGAYVNFLGSEGAARIGAAYPGRTGQRLAEIKMRYDPDNFFHLNQNIRPQSAALRPKGAQENAKDQNLPVV